MPALLLPALLLLALVGLPARDAGAGTCGSVAARQAVAGVRGAIARACPCADYDGSTPAKSHQAFVNCVKAVIADATDGTPVLGAYTLPRACVGRVLRIYRRAACGYPAAEQVVMCCQARAGATRGRFRGRARPLAACSSVPSGRLVRRACYASPFEPEACIGNGTNPCRNEVLQETVDIPSAAQPANTPGSPAVVVTNPKLLTQFGGGSFSLNNARYTRYYQAGTAAPPDAVLILVPGFEGGAGDMKILAENLIARAIAASFRLEVWGIDRRTNQLEDLPGLDVAEEFADPLIALDWLYGAELGLSLHPLLAAGPNRRAVFYDTQADVPFIANWTPLVFSQDIDAVVEAARAVATNQNVFLGGHSAGTGFAARYAATDFDLSGLGPAIPGYTKVRGLVLLEGGGGSTAGTPLTADTLDRIEAKFDGGLFGAVRDNAPRCVDGVTPCTIATESVDCVGQIPPKCTPPTSAYAVVPGLLNPRILAAGEVTAIQAITDPDTSRNVISADQGAPGNNAVAQVPDLATLAVLGATTAHGGLGSFLDDDGLVAPLASFVATSVGAPGPIVNGLRTWQDITEGPMPMSVLPNNGPPPTSLPAGVWGQEKEITRLDRMAETFYKGGTNFTDLYYPSSGLSVTSVAGICTAGICTVGNVGASCTTNAQCNQAISLDSTALSIGRGRRDIENLTQAGNIDIPVIAFGGSNGLTPVPASFLAFANSIATCTAPSCTGAPRVVNPTVPSAAFPTFGGVAGGFEVVIAEGFAHVDVLTAEDNADNPIPEALLDFLVRNSQ